MLVVVIMGLLESIVTVEVGWGKSNKRVGIFMYLEVNVIFEIRVSGFSGVF